MRSRLVRFLAVPAVLAALLSAPPAVSTTIKPMAFDEVVRASTIVVEGTVVDIQVHTTGTDIRTQKTKTHAAPMTPSGRVKATYDKSPASQSTAPQSAGVEGGRMLVTEITLAVQSEIAGSAGSTVRFKIAGGTDEHGSIIVYGMPAFELGQKYIVFLRSDFEISKAPIVGVNQGYFRVVRAADGEREMLLNADGDIVIGIENRQVQLQHNPWMASRSRLNLAPAPTPEAGSNVHTRLNPRVQRYWSATETPMSRESFFEKVRAAKGVTP